MERVMEEEAATPMETDVSSTTQDIPAAQDVQASSSTMEITLEVAETTVEVEEMKEEDDQDRSIDSNTPETNLNKDKSSVRATNITSSPLTPPKRDNSPKTTPQKTLLQKVTPQKVTHVIVDEASSSDSTIESNKSSLKDPLTTAPESILPDLTSEIDIPAEIKLDYSSVKITSSEVSQNSTVSSKSATPEIVIVTREKDDSNESQFTETSTTESTEILHKSIRRGLRSLINSTKKDESNESICTNETFTTESSEKETKSISRELRALIAKKDESNESLFTNESSTTEQTEKEPKSISRELKSLIKSAKESKIINECTQLTSKTRKSRTQNDSLNSTLNTSIEVKKIQARRGSDHSQVSNVSSELDISLEAQKRSMRSQNPDFATKQKQFISSVTARLQKDEGDGTTAGSDEEIAKIKVDTPKKKPATPEPSNEKPKKLQVDPYCWRCHYLIEDVPNEKKHPPAVCSICPREYHFKCLSGSERTLLETEKQWVCPECMNILVAEGSETRSPAMRKTNLAMLCELLKYALNRMMEANGVEPFINPVDRTVFPDYDKYVVHPMDLTLIKESIGQGLYGSTEAFIADVCWILHNSIIFNTLQSKLTAVARTLVRSAKQEMSEIEACPECYAAANARRPTWFTDVCSTPHILLWAKLKGFPYWPAKGMSVNTSGMVDVRFFGAHDRAWVYPKDCFLYSEKDPNNFRTKRQDILDSMQEAENHIRNIARKFGKFIYPEFRVAFDPSKMSEQLNAMIPGYVEEFPRNVVKDKQNVGTPPPQPGALTKRRSVSKSSKDHDGETSDAEDSPTASKKKALDTTESPKEDKSSESVKATTEPKATTKPIEESIANTRKRRRSMLEEATTMTILDAPSEKKKRVNSSDADVASSPSILQKAQENKSTDRPKTPKPPKEDKPKTPKPKHSTPKIVLKNVPVQKKTPQSIEKAKPKLRRVKSSSSDKSNDKNKSISTPQSKSNTPQRTAETKTDKAAEKSTPKAEKSILIESATKENNASNSNSAKTTPNRRPMPRSVKDKIVFDDDTTLAVLAKKCAKADSPKPNMLTITNVRSLSQPGTSKSPGSTNTTKLRSIAPAPAVPVASSAKNKKQEQVKTIVGTVGVRSFARMTSPTREAPKTVEIEVKAEPMDFEDAERQNQKIEMLNAFRLRPVNPPAAPATSSLRQVRVTKGNIIVEKHQEKKTQEKPQDKTPEPRPKAKKSFPQPKKPDESRSDLNGKNSMVYIPIQPPMTQAPGKQGKVNGPVPSGPPALRHSSAIPNNASSSPAKSTMPAVPPSLTMSPTATATVSAAGAVRPANVQTVPLITSVNGQWTFSLQPVLAVGGENPNPPLVNGLPQPGPIVPTVTPGTTAVPPTEPPKLMSSPTASGNMMQETTTPGEPPKLQQKPSLGNPFDPKTADAASVPSEAGPVSTKLNQNATKLADFFRSLLEDSLEKLNNPAALVTVLRSEIEKLRWTHKQEIIELQHNHELQMTEMRTSFMKEKTRAVAECRKSCAADLEMAVNNAKRKQWCANCRAEAQFYCCWNTSYCDYACQRAHWTHHYAQCTQQRDGGGDGGKTTSAEDRLQPPADLPKVTSSNTVTVGGKVLHPRVLKNASVTSRAPTAVRPQGKSLIVISDRDAKCVGTFKPATNAAQSQFILNKQLKSTEEAAKKMVSSGGYLIIGGDNSPSPNSPIVIN